MCRFTISTLNLSHSGTYAISSREKGPLLSGTDIPFVITRDYRYPTFTHLWTSHKQKSVPSSTRAVSLLVAKKPALLSPQAYAFPCNSRYVPSLAIHQETWVSSPGKRKRAGTLLHDGSVFTQGTEFTLEPVSTILLSRYSVPILPQPDKNGNGRKVSERV